jgi:hypothetical protein
MKKVSKLTLSDNRLLEVHVTRTRTHIALRDDRAPEELRWTVTIIWGDGRFHVGRGATHRKAYGEARTAVVQRGGNLYAQNEEQAASINRFVETGR